MKRVDSSYEFIAPGQLIDSILAAAVRAAADVQRFPGCLTRPHAGLTMAQMLGLWCFLQHNVDRNIGRQRNHDVLGYRHPRDLLISGLADIVADKLPD